MCFQDVTLQHYMDYTAESLIPVMAHIAKNVVKVNEGQTKHMVSCETNLISFNSNKTTTLCGYITEWHSLTSCPLQAIKGKYSTSKQMRIATISQLKSSVVKDLAKQLTQWDDHVWHNVLTCTVNFLRLRRSQGWLSGLHFLQVVSNWPFSKHATSFSFLI